MAGDSCESSDSDDATKKQGLKYYEFFKEIVKVGWMEMFNSTIEPLLLSTPFNVLKANI